jgi:hypothetical protein
MWSKTSWLLICILALLPSVLLAEGTGVVVKTDLTYPLSGQNIFGSFGQGLSLLDPQRLHMSQSYGLVYSSRGKSGDLVGLYQNMLSYRVSPSLNVKVNLGYFHRPLAINSNTSTLRHQALMTAFQLDFQPIDNVFIQFNYRSQPVIDYRDSLWRFRGGWGSMGD